MFKYLIFILQKNPSNKDTIKIQYENTIENTRNQLE